MKYDVQYWMIRQLWKFSTKHAPSLFAPTTIGKGNVIFHGKKTNWLINKKTGTFFEIRTL